MRTNLLGQVVPLEFGQVLERPQVVVVRAAPRPAHLLAIEQRGHALGHGLVLKLHPALCKVLTGVAAAALPLLARQRVCVERDKQNSAARLVPCLPFLARTRGP